MGSVLLLVCYLVILEENRVREIRTRAAAGRHLVLAESWKSVDLQRGTKRRQVDRGIGFKEIRGLCQVAPN